MSTDLHLHPELPKLRVSAVKKDDDKNTINQNTSSNDTQSHKAENENDSAVTDAADDESYRTPTSKESKIPEILTCPPAPRKPKALASCKRKLLDEFQFFEVTNKEDMDAFFRSTFPKRTCPCT